MVEEFPLKVDIGGRDYSLAALIVKPGGARGRLPIALIAHGSPRDNAERPKYRVEAPLPRARDLAHRGWSRSPSCGEASVSPKVHFAEGFICSAPDFRRAPAIAAEDIEGVRAAVAKRPDAGGTGALVPGRNCDEDGLVSAFASSGARSRVPTLWLYAENDSYFGPALVRRMHAAFTHGGGEAKLDMFGPVGEDGHKLWSLFDGLVLWLPVLDRFLRAQGAPTWDPRPIAATARRRTPAARRDLESYLSAPTEKALSIARRKGLVWLWSGASTSSSRVKRAAHYAWRMSRRLPCPERRASAIEATFRRH